jgi:ABC-type Fe3+-hydroxamate transport system substrate-binding protein
MARFLPLVLVVVGLAVVVVTTLSPPARDACLARVHERAAPPLATVERHTAVQATVHYADGLDLEVVLGPQRIVSTLPGITEMLAHLGALDRLVGRSPHCDTPRTVLALPEVSVQPLSAEALLALEPDLVVLDRRLHRADLEAVLRRVDHVLLLETSRSLAELRASFVLLADVLDDDRARQAAAAWVAEAQALEARLLAFHRDPPPRVLVAAQWEPLYAIGPGGLFDDMLAALGAVNIACDLAEDASGPFSAEVVLARQPTWILGPARAMPTRLRDVLTTVPAVAEGRVLPVLGADAFLRGGPRILRALEILGGRLLGYHRPGQAPAEGPEDAGGDPDEEGPR